MNTSQIQIKVSLSEQLNDLLESKAARVGVHVTQFVKHLILKDVEKEDYPIFKASEKTIQKAKKALKEKGKAVSANNISAYFKNL